MRLLQLSMPARRRETLLGVLDDHGLGYTVAEGDGVDEGHDLVTVVVPADAVERVLGDLEEAGYDRSAYTASLEAEFATFEGIDEVQQHWAKTPNRIAPETLRSKARDMRPNTQSYVWLMFLSTVIATAGLLIGSAAILVGSMVLAPLVAPMLTASIGAVRNDRKMIVDSLRQQAIGLGVAVVGAVVVSYVMRTLVVVPVTLDVTTVDLFSVRLSPGLLSVLVGLAAGAAGAFGLTTKGNVSIVGVMVAAALIPTAAAAGVGFAWGAPSVGYGALMLLGLTILSVNVGSYLMLGYLGYKPDSVDEGVFDLSSARETAVTGATVLAIAVVVIAVLAGSVQHFQFEHGATLATTDVLNDDAYEELELRDLTVQYGGISPVAGPTNVSVGLTRRSDRSYPELPNDLEREIANRTGQRVVVLVTYADYDVSNATGARALDASTDRRTGAASGRQPTTERLRSVPGLVLRPSHAAPRRTSPPRAPPPSSPFSSSSPSPYPLISSSSSSPFPSPSSRSPG